MTRRKGGLAALQSELAGLLMDSAELAAFAAGPKTYAAARLAPTDAAILGNLNPKDLAYFASRRSIDRRGALKADMPDSVRLLERKTRLLHYFRAYPFPYEDPRKEARRFARWTRRAVRDGLAPATLPDLASVEAAMVDLRSRKPRRPAVSARPCRAPNVRLFRLRHDLSAWFSGRRAKWPERESWVALHLGADGRIVPYRMDAHDWEVLWLADGHHLERTLVDDVAERFDVWNREVQRSIRELRREGLLCPDR